MADAKPTEIEAFMPARRRAREWIAREDWPPGMLREFTVALARAFVMHGIEAIDAGTSRTIGLEVQKRYVERELAADARRTAR